MEVRNVVAAGEPFEASLPLPHFNIANSSSNDTTSTSRYITISKLPDNTLRLLFEFYCDNSDLEPRWVRYLNIRNGTELKR